MNVCIGYNKYIDKNGNEIYLYHIGETIDENGDGFKYIGTCKRKSKLDIKPNDYVQLSFKQGQYGWYINDIRKEN